MVMSYKLVLRPLLFAMEAERAHRISIQLLKISNYWPFSKITSGLWRKSSDKRLSQVLWGLPFDVPIGLAAGYDKNAEVVTSLPLLGFGHMEIGTVTPTPQSGGPKPRAFRLLEDKALLNRLGFNNDGAEQIAERLAKHKGHWPIPLGINIGKQKDTSLEDALEDYLTCFQKLHTYADYFVVNVSSPNTPGLRKLQTSSFLEILLPRLKKEDAKLVETSPVHSRPILVKLSPDLSQKDFDGIITALHKVKADGIILTNTTTNHKGLHSSVPSDGGVSGKPLFSRSLPFIKRAYGLTKGNLPIIGSGGIFTAEDAYAMIRAGASLLQVYTVLVYEGPGVISRIHLELAELLKKDGFSKLSDAVGTA